MTDCNGETFGESLKDTCALLDRLRAGDEDARNGLFERYRPRLDLFLRARLPGRFRALLDTQDLVQEVCVRVLPRLDAFEYRGLGSFWTYLRRIALNQVRDAWNAAARRKVVSLPQDSRNAPAAGEATPLFDLLDREEFEAFERVLATIPERRRHALLLRLELDLEFKMIAEECDYPSANAARMDVTRLIERVAREMAAHEREA